MAFLFCLTSPTSISPFKIDDFLSLKQLTQLSMFKLKVRTPAVLHRNDDKKGVLHRTYFFLRIHRERASCASNLCPPFITIYDNNHICFTFFCPGRKPTQFCKRRTKKNRISMHRCEVWCARERKGKSLFVMNVHHQPNRQH